MVERAHAFFEEMKKQGGKHIIASTHRNFIFQCKRHFDNIRYTLNPDSTKTKIKIRNGEFYNFYMDIHTGKASTTIKNQTFTADFIAE